MRENVNNLLWFCTIVLVISMVILLLFKDNSTNSIHSNVDNKLYPCTEYISDNECNICIVENDRANIYVYGENSPNKIIGTILYFENGIKVKLDIYNNFFVIWLDSSDFHYHCTTNLRFEEYDNGFFKYGVNGGNKNVYNRIMKKININEMTELKEEFDEFTKRNIQPS